MRFTFHALERLKERSTLKPENILAAIQEDRIEYVTIEHGSHRVSYLIFSPAEEVFLIVVVDDATEEIVTVLPLEYWDNLRRRKQNPLPNKRPVTVGKLIKAVRHADPEHEILRHPPLCGKAMACFFALFERDEKLVRQRITQIPIEDFVRWRRPVGIKKLRMRLKSGLGNMDLGQAVPSIFWKTTPGKAVVPPDPFNPIEFHSSIKFGMIFGEASRDFRRRLENTNRFPIFDWVVERNSPP